MNIMIYFFPILINSVLSGIFFITSYRFAAEGSSGIVVGMATAVWSVIYGLISILVGRIANSRNAPVLIELGGIVVALSAFGFIILDGLYMQFFWIALNGCGIAFYCMPFQLFMKRLEPDARTGVVRASALYTWAWSMGFTVGPFIFGLCRSRVVFTAAGLAGLLLTTGVHLIANHMKKHRTLPTVQVEAVNAGQPVESFDLAWLGWLVGGIGVLAVTMLRAMWPYRGAELKIDKSTIGMILALVNCVQGFFALALMKPKTFMFRPLPAVAAGAAALFGLGIFATGENPWLLALGAISFGIYSGYFYFCLVYYALVHPIRAGINVAVNEAVVGVTGIVGPLAGGFAAGVAGAFSPFAIAAILCTTIMLFQAFILFRLRKNTIKTGGEIEVKKGLKDGILSD